DVLYLDLTMTGTPVDLLGGSLQRGDDLTLEELDAAGVVGGLGEVEDPVGHPEVTQRAEVLHDLLGGAARGHAAHRAQLLLHAVLGHAHRAEPVGQPLEPVGHLGLVAPDRDVVVRRADDAVVVGADVAAVLGEDRGLVGEGLRRPVEVRVVGVARRDAQRHALTPAGDPQRHTTLLEGERPTDGAVDRVVHAAEGGHALAPGLAHDLHALLEHGQPLPGPREAVPVGAPLVLVPARTDPHLDAATADVVHGRGHLGQVHRRAVGHAGAHLPEPDPLGRGRERGHERPRLVRGLLAGHGRGVEVVVHPHRLPRPGVGTPGQVAHDLPVPLLLDPDEVESPALGNEHSESHARSVRQVTDWSRHARCGTTSRPLAYPGRVDTGEDTARDAEERIWTVPNAISFLRLALIPVFAWLIVAEHDAAALLVLAVAGASDWVDGDVARRFDQASRLGRMLDPAADRLYIFVTLIGLAYRELVPWWLVAVIVARELVLAATLPVLLRHGYGPLPVHMAGKAGTFCLMYAFPLLLLASVPGLVGDVSWTVGWVTALWGVGLYWFACLLYLEQVVRIVRRDRRATSTA